MTRDPARIDPILADLRRYWHAAPDLRLGQMVMGLLDLSGAPRYGEFHAEDDKVAAYLAAWAAANPPPPDHRDTLPPEIEAAIARSVRVATRDGVAIDASNVLTAKPSATTNSACADLRTAITSALAAAREAGRRDVLDVAAGVEEAIESIACRRCGHDDPLTTSDADRLFAAIAADKAALDDTWRAHDLERDAEVAQAQAATHEACAALQAICAALHVAPPTGSTYCTEAVAMVVERVAADKAREVETGISSAFAKLLPGRPTPDEARRLVDAFASVVDRLAGFADDPPANRDHYNTQMDRLIADHKDARAALLRALGVEA